MDIPSTFPTRGATVGPDPSLTVRRWVALFLRIGIGLSLLSSGLSGYFGMNGSGGGTVNPFGSSFSGSALDPFFSALPYLAIGIGLALILGFLTTISAISASFFSLLMPIFYLIQIISNGLAGGSMPGAFGRGGYDPFSAMIMTMTLPSLIPMAAMIWLSPLENHPYSVDSLIFSRNAIEIPPAVTPEPASVTPEEVATRA